MSKADISIRGKTISIACAEGQEERIQSLGKRFDERIKALEEAIGDVGDMRLLVAAGLSLLDELDEVRNGSPNSAEVVDLDNRITLIERTAAAALSDAATRINRIALRVEEVS